MTALADTAPLSRATTSDRAIGLWLLVCCAMVFLMVIIGGVTRLTESGLSITEWKPVTGVIPPLSTADWQAEFEKYQQIPEYRAKRVDMTLDEFKAIYFWEYVHRLWGRLIGLVFAVPLAWFAVRGQIPRALAPRLAGFLVLGGAQGFMGWYMVKSGLVDRVDVSQYRLVAHLGLAVVIYGAMLWTALGILAGPRRNGVVDRGAARGAGVLIGLVFLTLLSGGFVAGLDAGLTYNTFPLMDGHWIPVGYAQMSPLWINFFENVPAVQFNHRLLATTTFGTVVLLWALYRWRLASGPARHALDAVFGAALLQVTLGISTLLLVVPIPLAAAHQAGAIVLLTAAIVLRHRLVRGA